LVSNYELYSQNKQLLPRYNSSNNKRVAFGWRSQAGRFYHEY